MAKKGGNKKHKKQSPLEKEYKKLRKNLEKQVESMEKRGYVFNKEPIPKVPKKITEASIRNLKNIKENIYNKAEYLDPKTGAFVTGKRGREIERSKAGKKAAETRKINEYEKHRSDDEDTSDDYDEDYTPPISDIVLKELYNFLRGFESYDNRPFVREAQDARRDNLIHMLDTAIEEIGYEDVAQSLENSSEDILDVATKYIVSSSDTDQQYYYEILATVIWGGVSLYFDTDPAYES